MTKTQAEPRLAPPGAGLPVHEWLVAKYIIFPRLFKTTSKEEALSRFADQSEKLLAIARAQAPEDLVRRQLVKRLQGMEDSSRYWSVAMVLDHLTIVGSNIQLVVSALSRGKTIDRKASIKEVKPRTDLDPLETIEKFEKMSDRFVSVLKDIDVDAFPNVKYSHPWFGPLNAHQWLIFAAPHEDIHRRQALAIVQCNNLDL
ncbi:MAG: DinB family protein [Cyanobacteria bacterium HKST-UBA02]|nr:DinB family protein [Cyanobacteria bacterium HKST-UBA02]